MFVKILTSIEFMIFFFSMNSPYRPVARNAWEQACKPVLARNFSLLGARDGPQTQSKVWQSPASLETKSK